MKIPREENRFAHRTIIVITTNGSNPSPAVSKTIFTIQKLDSKNRMNFQELSFRFAPLKSNFLSAFDAPNHILYLAHTMLFFALHIETHFV